MSVNVYNKDTQTLTEVAGTGTVEFGASTVRTGTVTIPAGTSGGRFSITYDSPMNDTDYVFDFQISYINSEDLNNNVNVLFNSKKTTGADLWIFGSPSDKIIINYTAFKLHTVEGLEELEAAVGELKPSSPVLLEKTVISGLTTAWRDNSATAHRAYRVGNLVIMNVSLTVSGTYSGTTGWVNLWNMPTSLLESGESFVPPYFSYIVRDSTGTLGDIISGQGIYLINGTAYSFGVQGQIVLIIV